MARKNKTESNQNPIEQYEHKDKQRLNNPPVGLVDSHTDNGGLKKKTYQYDPHLLIAGDSLLVMNPLLEKEGIGGKVQMVYFDPPYGIK